jgi:hypothetical protein
MSISTYFRSNIHQNGPEILGVILQIAGRLLAGELTRMGNSVHAFIILLLANCFSMYFCAD